MEQVLFTITENRQIKGDVYRMMLCGDTGAFTAPGQFLNIQIDGLYLRRPISVNDLEEGQVTILYKVIGKGTERLCRMAAGEKLDILTGLGNGFDITKESKETKPLLIGGGIGTAPLYYLAKELVKKGCKVQVILGFKSEQEVYYEQEFASLGCQVFLATEDGSRGVKGFVTDAIAEETGLRNKDGSASFTSLYTCGPEPMLKAVYRKINELEKGKLIDAQYSFEERMGCGFGACMGCSCKTVTGYKRICKDGPVLRGEEILWQ